MTIMRTKAGIVKKRTSKKRGAWERLKKLEEHKVRVEEELANKEVRRSKLRKYEAAIRTAGIMMGFGAEVPGGEEPYLKLLENIASKATDVMDHNAMQKERIDELAKQVQEEHDRRITAMRQEVRPTGLVGEPQ